MDYLVVRNQDGVKRVHLSEISILIVESTAVSLTAYLLCELSRRKIDVLFCDEKQLPYGMLLPLYGSHDTSLHYRTQIEWRPETKALVWAEIVKAKIRGQISVLPPEKAAQRQLLASYIGAVLPNDASNREGHAAKVYFNALFGMSFVRDRLCPVNAALNYGYGVLLSAVAREIAAAGFCTQLGIFHDNRFNAFNLASDLMEPFRPFLDAVVYDMAPQKFEREEKQQVVQALNQQVTINGKQQFMINAIAIFVKSVFAALEQNDPSLLCFPDYEL